MNEFYLGLKKSGSGVSILLFVCAYVLSIVSVFLAMRDYNTSSVNYIAWIYVGYFSLIVLYSLFFGLTIAGLLFNNHKIANLGIGILSGFVIIDSGQKLATKLVLFSLYQNSVNTTANVFEIVEYSCLLISVLFIVLIYFMPKNKVLLRSLIRILLIFYVIFGITTLIMLSIANNYAVSSILKNVVHYALYPILVLIAYANVFDDKLAEEPEQKS